MRQAFRAFSLWIGLLVAAALSTSAAADERAAWTALRAGGYVALMRHGDAPGGVGDPPGFRLDDCSTQRNLSPRGRAQARAMGVKLKAERIAIGKFISS